jgi:hypothetical protein
MRFMSIYKTLKESDTPPTAEHMADMGRLIEEFTKSGVLVETGGLQSSAKGVRVRKADGKTTVTDGPFTESKELIAGYAILEVTSRAHAVELAKRFLDVVGEGETEVRQMHEMGG